MRYMTASKMLEKLFKADDKHNWIEADLSQADNWYDTARREFAYERLKELDLIKEGAD